MQVFKDPNIFIQEIISLPQELQFAFANEAMRACIFLEPQVGVLTCMNATEKHYKLVF